MYRFPEVDPSTTAHAAFNHRRPRPGLRWFLLTAVTLIALWSSAARANAFGEEMPQISGTAYDGQTLSTTDGTWWVPNENLFFTYQWLRCDLDNVYDCSELVGATQNSVLLTPQEVNFKISVLVTASDGERSETQMSFPAGPVNALAPNNTASPFIEGDPHEGETLTANPGTWTGTPQITFEYQWYLCNSDGVACQVVDGATGTTFAVTGDMIGRTVSIGVAAYNGGGITGVFGSTTTPITPDPPTAPSIDVAPAITGTTTAGETLTVSDGVWNSYETPVYTYQWQRCFLDGSSCTDVIGATDSTLELGVVDIRHQLRATVTATNGTGSDTTTTITVGPVNGPPLATTMRATDVTATSARLNGVRDTRLTDGEFVFAWGTLPYALSPETVGSAAGDELGVYPLTLQLNDLTPSTTYYFHLSGHSAIGGTVGGLLSFTTEAAPVPAPTPAPELPARQVEVAPGAFAVDVRARTQAMEKVEFAFTLPEAGRGTFTGTVVDDRRHVGAEHNRQASKGKPYVAFSRSFVSSDAGKFELPATLSARAMDKIRQRGFLRVTLKTEFTPAGSRTARSFKKVVKLRPFAVTAYGTVDSDKSATATLRTPRTGRLAVHFLLRDQRTGESRMIKAFAPRELAGGSYIYTAPLSATARTAIRSGKVRLMVKARLDTNLYSARMLRSRFISLSNSVPSD